MYDWMKGAKLLQSALAGGCMDAAIRLTTEADAEGMLEVYAPVVLETAISFDEGAAITGGIPDAFAPRWNGGPGWPAMPGAILRAMPAPASSICGKVSKVSEDRPFALAVLPQCPEPASQLAGTPEWNSVLHSGGALLKG